MTKYIKLFETHAAYNTYITGNDKILPNVSYCENENEVHYNKWVDPVRFVAKFNVTSTTSATSLFNNPSLLKELEIDGVIYTGNDIFSHYRHTFSTTGIHTVKYTLNDGITSIDSNTFASKYNMVSITIPNTITTITNATFGGCSGLTNITIPNSVTSIGDSAFGGCSGLTSITIPNSVTSIGYGAFGGCTGLTSITIPSSVTTIEGSLSDFDFENVIFESINPNATFVRDTTNKILTNIAGDTLICGFNNTIAIPNTITTIGNYAFYGCESLTSVTIPNSVFTIRNRAFYGCSGLTSVTIGNGVTSISYDAFNYCTVLTSMIVNSGNSVYDSRNNCNAIIRTSYNSLIAGCQNTVIPNTVTNIGQSAFEGCRGLTSITIPNSVTSISQLAFFGCTGLTSVTIPDSVTSIGGSAFQSCYSLTSVTIGNGVTSIGNYVFDGCKVLTSVTLEATTPPTLGSSAFSDNASGRKIYVPSASVATYQAASGWSTYASDIEAIPTT